MTIRLKQRLIQLQIEMALKLFFILLFLILRLSQVYPIKSIVKFFISVPSFFITEEINIYLEEFFIIFMANWI